MKKILFIVVFTLLSSKGFTQWVSSIDNFDAYIYKLGKIGDRILVNAYQGFYFSEDSGQTFVPGGNGLPLHVEIKSFCQYGSNLFAGTKNLGIYMSPDSGNNWSPSNTGITTLPLFINCFTEYNSFLLAGTTLGLYVSANSGNSWSLIQNLIPNSQKILSLASTSNNVVVGTDSAIYVISHNGSIWQVNSTHLVGNPIESLFITGNKILASSANQFYSSPLSNYNWMPLSILPISTFRFVNEITSDGSILYCLTDGGNNIPEIYSSTNGGQSWTDISTHGHTASILVKDSILYGGDWNYGFGRYNGIDWDWNNLIGAVTAIAPIDSMVITGLYNAYYVTEGPHVSFDYGNYFKPTYGEMNYKNVECMVTLGNIVYTGTWGGGVFVTLDAGETWTACNSGFTSLGIDCMVADGNTLYAGTGYGIWQSVNYGQSWNMLPGSGMHIIGIAIYGDTIYASGQTAVSGSHELMKCVKGGSNWININSGLPNAIAYAINVYDSTMLVGLSSGGVYRSNDRGASWLPSNTGIDSTDGVSNIIRYGNDVFINLYYQGVYHSTDNGLTWNPDTAGFLQGPYQYTTLAADDSMMYVGSFRKIYHRPINEMITCLASIHAVGSPSICSGSQVLLYADSASGFNYQWKLNGVNIQGANAATYSVDSAGSYSCQVTMGCGTIGTNVINVFLNSPPIILQQPDSVVICAGDNGFFSTVAGGSNLSYQWKDNGVDILNDSLFSGATSSQLIITSMPAILDQHQYTCVVTDACGNSTTSTTALLSLCATTYLNYEIASAEIKIYPNPSNGKFEILINKNDIRNVSCSIFDLYGHEVESKLHYVSKNKIIIDLAYAANGFYIVMLNVNGALQREKIIVDRN